MARRSAYDNSYNNNKTRVDGRTDNWATRAGVTGQHKDSRGNVIGGVRADGTRFGTKSTLSVPAGTMPANDITTANTSRTGMPDPRFQVPGAGELGGSTAPAAPSPEPAPAATPQPSATPRLDAGVQTPRLDSNPAQDNNAKVAASNRSGAFGSGAQNLQARRDLYAKMQAAGSGAISDDMRGQAAKLGVTMGGWDNAVKRLTQAPAGIAAASPTIPWQSGPAPAAAGMPKPATPQAAPAAPQGIGRMAPQPNAKTGAAVPRPAAPMSPKPAALPGYQSWQAKAAGTTAPNGQSAPQVSPATQAIAGKPPTTAAPMTIGGQATTAQPPASSPEVTRLREANRKQDAERKSIAGLQTPPPTVKPPVIPPARTASRPITNPANVTFPTPWGGTREAFRVSYENDRSKRNDPGRFRGTPISSTLHGLMGATGKAARNIGKALTQTY